MTDVNWVEAAEARTFEVYNFVGGKHSPSAGTRDIEKRAARNGALLYTFGEGVRADVDAAVAAAKAALMTASGARNPSMSGRRC